MSGKIGKQENQVIFENKMLRYYDPKAKTEDIRNIIEVIEGCYSNAKKHSQALNQIEQSLPNHRVTLWN